MKWEKKWPTYLNYRFNGQRKIWVSYSCRHNKSTTLFTNTSTYCWTIIAPCQIQYLNFLWSGSSCMYKFHSSKHCWPPSSHLWVKEFKPILSKLPHQWNGMFHNIGLFYNLANLVCTLSFLLVISNHHSNSSKDNNSDNSVFVFHHRNVHFLSFNFL